MADGLPTFKGGQSLSAKALQSLADWCRRNFLRVDPSTGLILVRTRGGVTLMPQRGPGTLAKMARTGASGIGGAAGTAPTPGNITLLNFVAGSLVDGYATTAYNPWVGSIAGNTLIMVVSIDHQWFVAAVECSGG